MLVQVGKFLLGQGGGREYPEMLISTQTPEGMLVITSILWDKERQMTYLKTNGTKLQDYLVTWEDFKDFIKLIDEADYQISNLKIK